MISRTMDVSGMIIVQFHKFQKKSRPKDTNLMVLQGQSGFGSTSPGKNFLTPRKDGIKKLAVVSGPSTPY